MDWVYIANSKHLGAIIQSFKLCLYPQLGQADGNMAANARQRPR